MIRSFAATLLAAASLSACAQAPQTPATATTKPAAAATATVAKAGDANERARQAIKKLNSQITVDYVGAAPLPGFREVIAGGQLLYVSDDGRYLMQGAVLDLEAQEDLMQSSPALMKHRVDLLKTVPSSERIVFAPPNTKYTVSVFTDIECGYCRKLHSEIAELNKLGVAVEYLAFPRMGLGSKDHKDMISVWCSSDRKRALTEAKSGKPVPAKDCKNPVTMEYNLGQRIGVTGTPAIYAPDGTQLGGYLPPQALRDSLDKLASKSGKTGAAGK